LGKHLKVGAVDAHGKEHQRLGFLGGVHGLGGCRPLIGGGAIGDEEDPRPVVGHAVGLILLLPELDEIECLHDGFAHGRAAIGCQVRGREHVGGDEVLLDANRSERNDGNLDTLGAERIARQFLLELLEAGVELLDRLA
jgi:hypothetical protein